MHEPVSIDAPAQAEIARFPRAAGGVYRVVRDGLAHQGVGLYRVSADDRYLGSQISRPTADDCSRIEREHLEQKREAPPMRPVVYGYYGRQPDRRRSHSIERRAGVAVKRCSGCKEQLPLDRFNKGSGPGGLHRHCRACQVAWRAKKAAA